MIKEENEMMGSYETDGLRWNDLSRYGAADTRNYSNYDHGRLRSTSESSTAPADFHTKRHRAGSISGRLRTASDLEEIGLIDKNQKGVLKVCPVSQQISL
jgi:hypothetical protein